jgi:hypothetical protein
MGSQETVPIIDQFLSLRRRARLYFDKAIEIKPAGEVRDYWNELPQDVQSEGSAISQDLAKLAQATGPTMQRSPLP